MSSLALCATLAGGVSARAQDEPEPAAPESPAEPAPTRPMAPPSNATQALDQAAAAYEFGDIAQMVENARLVAEGALPAPDDQRADALRLLGIGLYLSGRPDGARRAFVDLLKLRPRARLDPALTRPEVVAYFNEVKRQNRPQKRMIFAFLPPLGQFQNGHEGRGWIIGGLEVLSLGAAAGTWLWLDRNVDRTTRECEVAHDTCVRVRAANWITTGVFASAWAYGVIDALVNHDQDPEDAPGERRFSFAVHPTGAAFRVSF